MNSPGEALQRRIWRPQAGVERVDIAPPSGERLPAGMTRPRFVRDVINGTAEGIDFKHRLAAGRGRIRIAALKELPRARADASADPAWPDAPLIRHDRGRRDLPRPEKCQQSIGNPDA